MKSPCSPDAPANAGEKQGGRFQRGQSGNPAGKKPGTRHRATRAALALMQGEVEAITRTVIDAALTGDLVAARLVLDRVAPPPRDRTIQFDLPPICGPQDAPGVMLALLRAVSRGELSPGEADAVARLLEVYRRIEELAGIEARLKALEVASGKTD